jgi:hypothetical protein
MQAIKARDQDGKKRITPWRDRNKDSFLVF